jgi:archaellum biogenesis ATPase FlaH
MVEFDPVAYLASKGYRGRPASGGREMTYPCFFACEEPSGSSKRKLYLHTSDGFFHCKVCGTSGGSYLLQKHFGDDPRSGTNDDPYMRRRILDSATDIGTSMLANNEDVMLYLLVDRGLTPETIIERKLGYIADGWSLVGNLSDDFTKAQVQSTGLVHRDGARAGKDFYYRHILIPYISRGHTIQMRGRVWGEAKGGKYLTGPGEPPRLFNADSLDGADEVIITEGEFDAIVLAQHLSTAVEERARKIAVIGLPGTNAIPDELDDVLSDVKRIYIGFDSDDPGQRAAETLRQRIGPRARVLELPFRDGRKCDWTEYLLPGTGPHDDWDVTHPYAGHTHKDVLRLMSSASGRRVFSMAEAGAAYRAYHAANEGLKTGYVELDATILPGLLPGQVVVILAKTGAGKTIFLCNLAYNMRAQRVLFISLEMTREEVYERMRRIYLFHHPHATDTVVEAGLANVYVSDENRLNEKELIALVNEFTVEVEQPPDVVFIDYLGYYARGVTGNSPYEKTSNAIMQLKAVAKSNRYVIITPHQVNRAAKEGKVIDLDDARDAGTVEETADFLLALYRPDDALQDGLVNNGQPSAKVKCSVLKSRHGGKGRVFTFQMDMLALAIVDDQSRTAQRARDHNYMHWRGKTWDDMRRQETAPRQMTFQGDT